MTQTSTRHISTYEAKAHFSQLLADVESGGQEIIITKHGKPVAKLVPVTELSITLAHGQAVADLPYHHTDPFDRMLIAQALTEGLPVLTTNRVFRDYGVQVIGRCPVHTGFDRPGRRSHRVTTWRETPLS